MKVFGFPVRVDPFFFVVLLVLGSSGGTSGSAFAGYLIGAALAILIHELGHALTARAFGGRDISIALVGFGGLTSYRLGDSTRVRRALISLAGPATGLVLGGLVWLVRELDDPVPFSSAAVVYRELLFVTFGWAVINLLPVLPLDGGHVLEELLPGDGDRRSRTAGVVTVLVGSAVCVGFASQRYWYPALLFGVLAVQGARVATARPGAPAEAPLPEASAASWDVFGKLVAGDLAGAVSDLRSGAQVELSLEALVRALSDPTDTAAQQLLETQLRLHPGSPMARSCLLLWRARQHRWGQVIELLGGGPVRMSAVELALHLAYDAGEFAAGAAIGEQVREAPRPALSFNTACCWARAGSPDLALVALQRAVAQGWTDIAQLDTDTDLALVRALPSYAAWRAGLPVEV